MYQLHSSTKHKTTTKSLPNEAAVDPTTMCNKLSIWNTKYEVLAMTRLEAVALHGNHEQEA
jgi:hypothetical protein